ncbi:MAG: hypothetical protein KDA28_14915, partial [Phycisphaerales bacterium]|nr:hypothetical protein [Phycisphaerales bacterium]
MTHRYLPLIPGITHVYADLGAEIEVVVVETLDEIREVAGLDARVVRDRVFVEELVIEDTRDWYAQDDAGNVWYMGEEVDEYEYDDEGEVLAVEHGGAWEAGLDVSDTGEVAHPGYIMLADPQVGDVYSQEYYADEAEDMGEVIALDSDVTLADGSAHTCLETKDYTPLEPGIEERKFYAEGIGVVAERAPGAASGGLELLGVFDRRTSNIPDFGAASFGDPTTVDHPFFPLVPGTTDTFEAETEDGIERVVVEVLEETREVAGVECVVVRDRVFEDDLLIEDTHDWYAQDDAGNVWYMGEAVDNYNYDGEGMLEDVTHEGAWEAGQDVADAGSVAQPGIQMWADPIARVSYYQEYYEGAAEDMAYVVRADASVELADGTTHEDAL